MAARDKTADDASLEARRLDPKAATKAAKADNAELQAEADKITAQGFRGQEVDTTPNEAYTVAGVTSSDTAAKADRTAGARTQADIAELGKA